RYLKCDRSAEGSMQQSSLSEDEDNTVGVENRQAYIANLYQCYAPALFEYIRHHTTALSDAEDILAEVFIGALRHDLTGMGEDEQRAWLWVVARNKVNDHYRQTRRRPQVSLETLLEILEDETTPEKLLLRQEEASYLRTYLRGLSVAQQEVLQLRFIGGLRC